MADVLIRNLPDEVLAAIDLRAKRLGLSRAAYLRRTLDRERIGLGEPLTVDHLAMAAELAADLSDASVMDDAWS